MAVLVWLIPLALGMGALGLMAFLWSLRAGQFEDLDGAAHRILMDDDKPLPPDGEDQAVDEAPEETGSGAKSR